MNPNIVYDVMRSKNGQWKKISCRIRRFLLRYILEGINPMLLGFDDYESASSFMVHEYKKQEEAMNNYRVLLTELENENARIKSLI